MTTARRRRTDHYDAERLLSGDSSGLEPGQRRVADLLAAAAGPARPDELTSERAALAAFRAAHVRRHLRRGSRPWAVARLKSAVMRALTVKAAAALITTAAGATALALTSGTLPNPLTDKPPAATSSAATGQPRVKRSIVDPGAHDTRPSPTPSSSATPSSSGAASPTQAPAPSAGASRPGGPSPSIFELCRIYLAGDESQRGKALESAEFAPLINAAGGEDDVDSYCQQLVTSSSPSQGATQPGPEPQPSSRADSLPSASPAGEPSPTTGR
jgi:hypothetical protein